ncbi:MAG: DUF4058 family protein [Oscillatoriaceae cyanobacterium Prado104]|jgi:hypothetical protein|nr:DUF4058 family protein [Oscillatoriaceae cyanobacterium Prado104]
MPSPFPGVDPYLEHPDFWPEVHHRLITAIAIAIGPAVRPKYRVAIEKRIYLSEPADSDLLGIPDLTVFDRPSTVSPPTATATLPHSEPITVTVPILEESREGYLEIREVGTNRVITVIEILSPKNKRTDKGREEYENKRQEVLKSASHLVEIDLLRSGKQMPVTSGINTDYRILISKVNCRPKTQIYAFALREAIPAFFLPLQQGDTEFQVDLQALFEGVYDRAGFDLSIDYTQSPVPRFKEDDAVLANALLQERGVR